ncbi:uncharacterized protein [Oscarella lobularis]|uniref:uncharacterized protein n=1 Tax=Oscarella lobularis TaxID=121494 RepID=UPI0033136A12
MHFFFLFTVVLLLERASAQTPVPSRPLGYTLQNGSNIVIDAFYDLLSSECQANWPVLQSVAKQYVGKVTLKIHMFPLPFNHQSFFVAQTAHQLMLTKCKPSVYSSFVTLILKNQKDLTTGSVNMSETQVKESIAELVSSAKLGLTESQVLAGFKDNHVYELSVMSWKYAAAQSITGTPEFIVNGVEVPNASTFIKEDWIKFIESLLKATLIY